MKRFPVRRLPCTCLLQHEWPFPHGSLPQHRPLRQKRLVTLINKELRERAQ